ncbi:F-box domain-containing protein [Mycena chlorophos]|uniref:F-box domain-containing protein n=1 Tax=Mycena chlorophos TaxID=658473 RepID=A0A8H6TBU4_MYCCL|nr:F-box domain-containing protein [Mycena chlorophos]
MFRHSSSPIHTLPVELLSHVFLLATHDRPEESDDCPPFNSESVLAPLTFAAVCRHWRTVALNTASLYTSICITPELLRESELDLRGIAAYLELSRNYALDILIDARDQDWDFDDEGMYTPWFTSQHMDDSMAVLLPHIDRWRSLCIFTDVSTPMHHALRAFEAKLLAGSNASRLESMRLMRCDAYAAYGEPESTYPFLSALPTERSPVFPRLRQLALRGVSAAWSPLAAQLPTSLRSLELAYLPTSVQPTLSELALMLQHTPDLERLTLNAAGPHCSQQQTDVALELPQLSSLHLGYTCIAAASALLHLLSAANPKIHVITLEDASDPASFVPIDAGPVLSFLFPSASQRPFTKLRTVTLRRVCATSELALPADVAVLDRLELVGTSETLFALGRAARRVCARGVFVGPFSEAARRVEIPDWVEYAARRLVETQTPRLVEVFEEVHAEPEQQVVEEWKMGETRVRVARMVMPSESEPSSDEDEDEDGASSVGSSDGADSDWMPFASSSSQPRSLITMLTLPGLSGMLGGSMVVRVRM